MRMKRAVMASVIVGLMGTFVAHVVGAQKPDGARNPAWDWPTYNRDLAGTRYSPLTQINTGNISTLVQAARVRAAVESVSTCT